MSSSFFFGLRARLAGERDDLRPGTYLLRKDSSYGDVLDRLSRGPAPVGTIALTRPELVREACAKHPTRIAIGIDARGGKVATEGWARTSEMTALSRG